MTARELMQNYLPEHKENWRKLHQHEDTSMNRWGYMENGEVKLKNINTTIDFSEYEYQTTGMMYKDQRGFILDCGEGEFKAIQTIFSVKGSIRSNHYHLKGGHLLHVISGKMRYRERPVGSDAISERIIYPGQSIFTGPMLVHETEFMEDTFLVCAATVSRGGENYQADLVREALIPLAHHPV